MKVTRPSKNRQTQGYSTKHKGYDFSGRGNLNCYADLDLEVRQSVNRYVNSWRSTPPLTTRDYGNYIKCRHNDGSWSLYAHLQKDGVPKVGSRFKRGEKIAIIGNTGNSTGRHLHYEYRNSNNINKPVQFEEALMSDNVLEKEISDLKIKLKHLQGEYEKEQKRLIDARREREELRLEVERLRGELQTATEDFQREKKALQIRNEEEKKRFNDLLRRLAVKLGVAQNEPEIMEAIETLLGHEDSNDKLNRELVESKKQLAENASSIDIHLERASELTGCKVLNLEAVLTHIESLIAWRNTHECSEGGENMAKKKGFDWNLLWNALKEPLRLLVLGVVSFAIAQLANEELQTPLIAGLLVALRFVDKYLHEVKLRKGWLGERGLTGF